MRRVCYSCPIISMDAIFLDETFKETEEPYLALVINRRKL